MNERYVSQASTIDRNDFFSVPNYKEVIQKAASIPKSINRVRRWAKPAIAIMVATGCRVGELSYLQKKHIKFYGRDGKELEEPFVDEDVNMMHFFMYTEKNKKIKHRIVPLIRNELFSPLFPIIIEYVKHIKNPSDMLFTASRNSVWASVKKDMGNDFFPHYLRHTAVTNDTRAGINTATIKQKYGWTDLRPHTVYSHLDTGDIEREQVKAFGRGINSWNKEFKMDIDLNSLITAEDLNIDPKKIDISEIVLEKVKEELRRRARDNKKNIELEMKQEKKAIEEKAIPIIKGGVDINLVKRSQIEKFTPLIPTINREPIHVSGSSRIIQENRIKNNTDQYNIQSRILRDTSKSLQNKRYIILKKPEVITINNKQNPKSDIVVIG